MTAIARDLTRTHAVEVTRQATETLFAYRDEIRTETLSMDMVTQYTKLTLAFARASNAIKMGASLYDQQEAVRNLASRIHMWTQSVTMEPLSARVQQHRGRLRQLWDFVGYFRDYTELDN